MDTMEIFKYLDSDLVRSKNNLSEHMMLLGILPYSSLIEFTFRSLEFRMAKPFDSYN